MRLEEALRALGDECQEMQVKAADFRRRVQEYPSWQHGVKRFLRNRCRCYEDAVDMNHMKRAIIGHIIDSDRFTILDEIKDFRETLDTLCRRNADIGAIARQRAKIAFYEQMLKLKED